MKLTRVTIQLDMPPSNKIFKAVLLSIINIIYDNHCLMRQFEHTEIEIDDNDLYLNYFKRED